MIIIEYKMNIEPDGTLVHPGWVDSAGWFYNNNDKTYVGTALDEADRNYYLPDTITILTIDDLKTRVKALPRITDTGGYTKTDQDIENEIDTWVSEKIMQTTRDD